MMPRMHNADIFKWVDRLTQSVGLHPRGGVDGVAEEAVTRHLDADHPGAAGAYPAKKEGSEWSSWLTERDPRDLKLAPRCLIVDSSLAVPFLGGHAMPIHTLARKKVPRIPC